MAGSSHGEKWSLTGLEYPKETAIFGAFLPPPPFGGYMRGYNGALESGTATGCLLGFAAQAACYQLAYSGGTTTAAVRRVCWRISRNGDWYRDRFAKSTTPEQAARLKSERLAEYHALLDAARSRLGTPEGQRETCRSIQRAVEAASNAGAPSRSRPCSPKSAASAIEQACSNSAGGSAYPCRSP